MFSETGRRRQRQHLERHLSRDDVGNQARVLLSRFIHDRLVDEGQGNVGPDQMIEPGTPAGDIIYLFFVNTTMVPPDTTPSQIRLPL